MELSIKRAAKNQVLFREVNERIAESAERFDSEETEFVCECADADCTHRISASLAEYEQVREDPATFLVAPGHEEADIEQVVSDRGRFRVVEKVQAAVRRIVLRLDRRSGPAPSES